jgi:hypothetical protein
MARSETSDTTGVDVVDDRGVTGDADARAGRAGAGLADAHGRARGSATDDASAEGRAGDGRASENGVGGQSLRTRSPWWPVDRVERRWIVGILVVAAVLRIAWLGFNHVDPPVGVESGDQYSYWYYGNEIADGDGYIAYETDLTPHGARSSGVATAYYPVGYPAILAGLFWTADAVSFGADPNLMLVAGGWHVLASVGAVALVYVIGRRLLGARAGLIAAGILAVFPNPIYQVTSLQLETTFVFLTLAALAILVTHDWSIGPPGARRLLAFGAVMTLSVYVRPFSLFVLLGLFLAVLTVGAGWRRALGAAAIPALVLVVAVTPWTIRNAVRLDAFVWSSTNMGDTLCLDRNDTATGGFRWANHDGCVDPTLPEAERNEGNTRKAVEWVIENPDRELLQIGRRAKLMFAESNDGILAVETMGSGEIFSEGVRSFYTNVADWYFYVVLVAAIAGLWPLVRRSSRPELHLVFVPMVALLVIPLLLWGNPRFHLPLIPFMALSAAALVTAIGRGWQRPSRDSSAPSPASAETGSGGPSAAAGAATAGSATAVGPAR